MYVAKPAQKNGGSAAAARSWGQRRGVAALGWVRNTQAGAATGPAAPKTTTGGECGRSGNVLVVPTRSDFSKAELDILLN